MERNRSRIQRRRVKTDRRARSLHDLETYALHARLELVPADLSLGGNVVPGVLGRLEDAVEELEWSLDRVLNATRDKQHLENLLAQLELGWKMFW